MLDTSPTTPMPLAIGSCRARGSRGRGAELLLGPGAVLDRSDLAAEHEEQGRKDLDLLAGIQWIHHRTEIICLDVGVAGSPLVEDRLCGLVLLIAVLHRVQRPQVVLLRQG